MTFDDIYIEYYQRCFLFAKSYLHDEMQSKDIASEAMITLWSTMKTEEVKNIRAFLMTVVKNQALNYLRNEHLRMEARENILDDELYELDFRISSLDFVLRRRRTRSDALYSTRATDTVFSPTMQNTE